MDLTINLGRLFLKFSIIATILAFFVTFITAGVVTFLMIVSLICILLGLELNFSEAPIEGDDE